MPQITEEWLRLPAIRWMNAKNGRQIRSQRLPGAPKRRVWATEDDLLVIEIEIDAHDPYLKRLGEELINMGLVSEESQAGEGETAPIPEQEEITKTRKKLKPGDRDENGIMYIGNIGEGENGDWLRIVRRKRIEEEAKRGIVPEEDSPGGYPRKYLEGYGEDGKPSPFEADKGKGDDNEYWSDEELKALAESGQPYDLILINGREVKGKSIFDLVFDPKPHIDGVNADKSEDQNKPNS